MFVLPIAAIVGAVFALVSGASADVSVSIYGLQGCTGHSGPLNVTGCQAGSTLVVAGSDFDQLDYTTEATVGIGYIYYQCDEVSASTDQLNCSLPYIPFASTSFLPVLIFNRSSNHELTNNHWVGLQYALAGSVSSSPTPPQLSVSSSTGSTGGAGGSDTRIVRSSSSSSSTGGGGISLPRIYNVSGCQSSAFNNNTTYGCSTNSAALFTISGIGFRILGPDAPVQLWAAESSKYVYSCGVSLITDTTIVCTILQPSLTAQDSGTLLQLTIATDNGRSNPWYVQLIDNGPYTPYSPSSSTSFSIGGLDFVTFVVLVTVAAVLLVFLLTLACCRGAFSVLRCCRSPSTLSFSSVAVPLNAALLSPPPQYAIDASLPYSSSSSRFGMSLPPNPANYPAVATRSGQY